MAVEFPTQYDPHSVEKRLYDFWLKLGIFHAPADSPKKKYCIVLPPPNVTGVLHMGHALTVTIEDILIRRKRMQGYNACWVPGTDHAGIATQMVVERHLQKEEGVSRHDLGREKFIERVWEWKKKSETTILGQLRLMGCSLDWERLHFTLDAGVSAAVRETFVRLFNEGLIYRDEAIIQWCPRCRTALSDLEVKFKESRGKLWHIHYVSVKDPSRHLTVATTRPETLLGDTAVAVHPDDERYVSFHGDQVLVPLTKRPIPVIQDAYVEREFGTGALKITPGHDPNDAAIGKKHGLAVLSIMDERAHLNALAGPYQGLSREKAREKILEDLKAQGLLEKEEDHVNNVGHCDRCGTVVEPRVSAQWFVNAEVLAKPAIEAVEKKEIRIIPEEWEKTYFEWMRNIRPWCISRQLWWGHRIPVWYCACGEMTAAIVDPDKCPKCGSGKLRQEEDVLDTWFSSGLWPFSTLGWPKDTPDLKTFYPNDVMETGFDILFFWVARMIMLGIKMVGKIPFHTVYLHPMVRDEYGQKMSKTKGNVKDPLEIIDRMGADSLRFTLAVMAVHGRDVLLSDSRIEGYRNFVNKIWNASRFVMMHFSEVKKENIDWSNEVNQWIWSSLNETKRDVNRALDEYRFFDAANQLYHFVWDTYCYWFIEFIKSEEELEARKKRGDSTALQVLEETLRLLHPLMPFLTEEIWQKLPLRLNVPSIAIADYPQENSKQAFPEAEARVERISRIIDQIRTQRGVSNLSPAVEISVTLCPPPELNVAKEITPFTEMIRKLAKAREVKVSKDEPASATHVGLILKDLKIYIPRAELGDVEQEKTRKLKEYEEKSQALQRAKEKLNNPGFLKAPEAVRRGVEKQRDDLQQELDALKRYLVEVGALSS